MTVVREFSDKNWFKVDFLLKSGKMLKAAAAENVRSHLALLLHNDNMELSGIYFHTDKDLKRKPPAS